MPPVSTRYREGRVGGEARELEGTAASVMRQGLWKPEANRVRLEVLVVKSRCITFPIVVPTSKDWKCPPQGFPGEEAQGRAPYCPLSVPPEG